MGNSTDNSPSNGAFAFGIFVEVISLWTLVGNIIIMAAVLKLYKPLTIPDILVFSLALSDLLNVLLPAQIINIMQAQFSPIKWSRSICITFTWSLYCFRLASVLTVSVIVLDRLIAIRKPLLYRSRVMHQIGKVSVLMLVIWLCCCFIAAVPYMAGESTFRDGACGYQLLDFGIYYGFFVEILGLLQLALVLYCYIAIRISTWHFLKRQGKFRKAQLDSTSSNHSAPPQTPNEMASDGQRRKLALRNSTSMNKEASLSRSESGTKRGSIIKYFDSKRRERGSPKLTEGMKQVAKLEKMMAVLVFLFYITWIPFLGSNLFSLITGKSNKSAVKVVGVFSLLNGFINPIVYATIYPRYRKGYAFVFRKILTLCGGKQPKITIADFNSSKIGRSRRLQTLKELKLNESESTIRESSSPPNQER